MLPVVKTFQSLPKAKLFGIVIACACLAVFSVICLSIGITTLTVHLTNFKIGWINTLVNWGTGFFSIIAGWFVLPAFMVLFAGFFQEKTISRVERAYYPDSVREEAPGFWPDMIHDIKFTFKAIFLNIIILPLYFLGIGFILSILLNSYLLGHEFFESAAGYHTGKPEAKKLAKNNRGLVYGGGFFIAILTLIPFVNLIMPILAIVLMVHVHHGIKAD